MRVGVVTLGCDKNTVDSERYLAELMRFGAEPVGRLDEADIIVVNTCGFIDAAKRESIDAILEAGRLRASGSCQAVVAVGCMVQRHRVELAEVLPEVDLFFGTSDADQLIPALSERGLLAGVPNLHPGDRVYVGDLPHVRYLKVSEGCDHGCAFCAIPLMRGRHRSFALGDVVREAQLLEAQGARELNLVAQDLAHYGRDRRDGVGLAELLDTLLRETAVPWLRMLYVYSSGLTPRVLELMATRPRIVPYLDMPIQHGSDDVLARMRRPERARTIRERVARIRDAVPGIALRTTCIVGFPGETDDDVDRLVELLEEVAFDRVGAFAYSPQEGTRAFGLADDVPDDLKRARLERVTELQRAITAERYEGRIGAVTRAMVDRASPDGAGAQGRVVWQADDVDGVTFLSKASEPVSPGAVVDVRIDAVVDDYDLQATMIGPAQAIGVPRVRRTLPVASSTVGSFGR